MPGGGSALRQVRLRRAKNCAPRVREAKAAMDFLRQATYVLSPRTVSFRKVFR